jgi:hypothetical protein
MPFTMSDGELGGFAAAVLYVRWLLRYLAVVALAGNLAAVLVAVGAPLRLVAVVVAGDLVAVVGCYWAVRGWERASHQAHEARARAGQDGG